MIREGYLAALVAVPASNTDPNWLLSTAAQSAAALVAIVGGFLVSRLVTLSSERHGLEHRKAELEDLRELRAVTWRDVHGERLAYSTTKFEDRWTEDAAVDRGQLDVDALLNWIPRGSSEKEMRPVAERLLERIDRAYERVEAHFAGVEIPPTTVDELRNRGLDVPIDDEAIYKVVASVVRSRRPKPMTAFPSIDYTLPSIVGNEAWRRMDMERQDARIAQEADLRAELLSLEGQIEIVDIALARVSQPAGLWPGIAVLCYFAAVGIVLPLAYMASRPVEDSLLFRRLIWAGFVSGLVALLVYIVWIARQLTRPSDSHVGSDQPDPSPQTTRAASSGDHAV
jgi:hypothetical protein